MVRTKTKPRRQNTLRKIVSRSDLRSAMLSTVVRGNYFAEPDTILVFTIFHGVFGDGTRLAMLKTICVPDSLSLKPGLGDTEGVLDKGVSRQPDYIFSRTLGL